LKIRHLDKSTGLAAGLAAGKRPVSSPCLNPVHFPSANSQLPTPGGTGKRRTCRAPWRKPPSRGEGCGAPRLITNLNLLDPHLTTLLNFNQVQRRRPNSIGTVPAVSSAEQFQMLHAKCQNRPSELGQSATAPFFRNSFKLRFIHQSRQTSRAVLGQTQLWPNTC
jgi:hypothetical protein